MNLALWIVQGLLAALLSAFVAYGRWRLAPLDGTARPAVAQVAH